MAIYNNLSGTTSREFEVGKRGFKITYDPSTEQVTFSSSVAPTDDGLKLGQEDKKWYIHGKLYDEKTSTYKTARNIIDELETLNNDIAHAIEQRIDNLEDFINNEIDRINGLIEELRNDVDTKVFDIQQGGTGQKEYTKGDIIFADIDTIDSEDPSIIEKRLQKRAIGGEGQALIVGAEGLPQ